MKLILHGTPNSRQREFFSFPRKAHGLRRRRRRQKLGHAPQICASCAAISRTEPSALRRTLPELRENHIIPLQRELYGIAPYNSTERVFRFPNGSRIKLGYCDTAQDVYQYQGQEYAIIGMEEATHFTEEQMRFFDNLQPHDTNGYFAAHVLHLQPRQRRPCMGEAFVYRQTVSAG